MEDKILIHRYEADITRGKGYYEAVRNRIQELVNFLRENEIERPLSYVLGLIQNNRSSKYVFEEKEKEITKNIPKILESAVKAETIENIKTCDEIINRGHRLFYYSDNSRIIDFSQWSIDNGKVVISEAAFENLVDSESVYIDTPGRKLIYEKAIAAKKAIDELNQAVSQTPQCGLREGLKVIGITPENNSQRFSILKIVDTVDIQLVGEHFRYIV